MTKKKTNKKQPWSNSLEYRESLYKGVNPSADFDPISLGTQLVGYLGGFRTGQGMPEDEARWAAYLGLPYDKTYAPDSKIRFEGDENYPDRQYQGLSKRAKEEVRKDIIPKARRIKNKYNKEWIQVLDTKPNSEYNDATIYHDRQNYLGDLGKFGIREVGNSGIYEVGDKYDFPALIPIPDRNEDTELMVRDTIWSDRANPKLYEEELLRRSNKHSLGGWFAGLGSKLDGINSNLTDKFFNSKLGKGLEGFGIKTGNIGGLTNTAATAIGGLFAGKNTTGVGKAMQGIGSLASNIPGIGGFIGAGVNLAGGLVNATFGSSLNKEFIDQTEQAAKQTANYVSSASTNAQLMSDYANMSLLADINKKDVGTEGWLSNKATDETERLNKLTDEANAKAMASIERTAENIDKQNDLGLIANYVAYGGPLNIFKDGGIYIKPSHRGRLTELKARTGKTEAELYNDGNPAHKKMVVFARNARKWKHDEGGPLDTRMELLNKLKERRNRKGVFNGGEFGGAGASSLFLESPDAYTLVKDTVWIPYRETFNQAFDKASKAGLETFMFDNKLYTTEKGDNPNNNKAGEERFIEGLLPVERTKKVKNVKAEGGELFDNGIINIGNGGTHEQSPIEGVPMGVDNEGVPNLVEEGEVIYNDYVFSNRLRVPKEIRQKYKLRGVTFADAVKQLQKESEERPNDPISDNTLNAIMSELQQEQEMIRMKKNNNKYAKGGRLYNKFSLGGEPTIDNPYSPYISNNEDYSKWFTLDPNNVSKVTSYSDPYKNLIFTADMARAYAKNNANDSSLLSYLAKGNKLEDLTDEDVQKGSLDTKFGWLHKARANAAKSLEYIDESKLPSSADINNTIKGLFGEPILNRNNTKVKDVPIAIEDKVVDEEVLPAYEGIEPMKNHWLRYTPIFGAGISVLNDWLGGNEPDYSNADMYQRAIEGTNKPVTFTPLFDYMAYKPVDIERYKNRLDANASASRRAIRNTSGGNRAAYLTGLLASDYNYGNQLGELMGNIEGINYSRYKDMKAYNKATNLANAEMAMKADMANAEQAMQRARMYGSLAEYRDAIRAKNRAEKSANLTNLIQGMGDLGRELTDKDKLRWLADKGVLTYAPSGKYTGNKTEKKTTRKGKYGGKLNKKRGGFTV